jgi:hypothetical protein
LEGEPARRDRVVALSLEERTVLEEVRWLEAGLAEAQKSKVEAFYASIRPLEVPGSSSWDPRELAETEEKDALKALRDLESN